MKSTTAREIGPVIVSIVALGIFVAALCIAWWTKDSSLQVLLGMAGTNASAVVAYWIGSSSGSQAKDATIARMGGSTTTFTTDPTTVTTETGTSTK